jgi:hypothetical protein
MDVGRPAEPASVNRDRPCPGGGVSNCSGISQNNWQFTQITATFTG